MGLWENAKGKIFGARGDASSGIEALVRQRLTAVMDPDLGQDIVSLGFVKEITLDKSALKVVVQLTTPACPVKEELKAQCEKVLTGLAGVESVTVEMSAQTQRFTSRPLDAAFHPALGGVKNLIAIASGKGGVGKSTTTSHIAMALAETGCKVGILDADVYGPSIPTMTAASYQPQDQQSELLQPALRPTSRHAIKIMSAGLFPNTDQVNILRGPMAANLVRQFLTHVEWGELDYLLLDFPPGTGDIQLTISQSVPLSGAVLVTTPQEVAVIDVRKAVRFFQKLSIPILGVIETMSYFLCDGCSKKHKIFPGDGGASLAREFDLNLLGQIPMEPGLAAAGDKGQPLVFGSNSDEPAAMAYRAAAKEMARQVSILQSQPRGLESFEIIWKQ